jgi:hypothetical protein
MNKLIFISVLVGILASCSSIEPVGVRSQALGSGGTGGTGGAGGAPVECDFCANVLGNIGYDDMPPRVLCEASQGVYDAAVSCFCAQPECGSTFCQSPQQVPDTDCKVAMILACYDEFYACVDDGQLPPRSARTTTARRARVGLSARTTIRSSALKA